MNFPRISKVTALTLCISFGLPLSGCAYRKPAPELPIAGYEIVADALAEATACGVSGSISPDVALQAKRNINAKLLSGYRYDEEYLNSLVSWTVVTPMPEMCNKIAMSVYEDMPYTEQQRQVEAQQQQTFAYQQVQYEQLMSDAEALDALADVASLAAASQLRGQARGLMNTMQMQRQNSLSRQQLQQQKRLNNHIRRNR